MRRKLRKKKRLDKAELVRQICRKAGLPDPRHVRGWFNRNELLQVLAVLEDKNAGQ